MKNRLLILFLSIIVVGILSACNSSVESASNTASKQEGTKEEPVTVKVGVTGSDGQYWEIIKEKALEKNIHVELVEFSDYILPNTALVNGEVDINSFQHLAFLSQFIVENDADIVPIGSTVVAPLGLYSEKYKEVSEIPDGSKIAVPNDPANLGRGLKVLQQAGLIELTEDVGLYPIVKDIINNPKNLEIVEVVAQQTPRVLPDVAASIINGGIAGQAGYELSEAIFHDDPNSPDTRPYVNVFATLGKNKDNEAFKTISDLYLTEEVAKAVEEDTKGASIVTEVEVSELQKELDILVENIKQENR
ncbi:MetQ/NlpA family ABC transporter substrate-binding protein [Ureibacillus sinduriensis]|uniref:Methionine ABC transporter substrate-binding protein n=1 Tax=Ureibacillus sinduriensis BLB-1 = JCM 15800 TaxID=1384057 RepID=A0A0A3HRR4_9BACL|nr:MetQ/NlpA family ABC transporter substrate-binding protein [Ureibacillus sinduriensis]KGR75099.1 methionine ABC transporter substrate-binding protein [Ureibacillus sinduriensis BLB-1 = JCM 15800]